MTDSSYSPCKIHRIFRIHFIDLSWPPTRIHYLPVLLQYCISISSVLIYIKQDLILFSKNSPREFPQTWSLSRSYESTSIWNAFIPRTSSASFHKGAYFSTEIIPDAVAAISLNTLYFFKKNHGIVV